MSSSKSTLGIKDFEKLNQIGKGGFGVVYRVRGLTRSFKNREYALKEIPNKKGNDERVRSEIDALVVLNSQKSPHRNKIVTYYGHFVEDGNTYIVMEYCKYGSLRDYIKKVTSMDIGRAADVMCQLVQGISLIHKCKIAHRDLTTGNVLISDKRNDGYLNIKIADFGLTKAVPKRPALQTCVGTPGYIAPEVMTHGKYDESADVFSLGAILYMMLVGVDPEGVREYANDGRTPVFTDYRFKNLDEDAKDLIYALMCKKEYRLRIDDIMAHEFIKRGLTWEMQKRGAWPRSGSADQRLAGARRTSGDGDPGSGRYSNGGIAPLSARHRIEALPPPPLSAPPNNYQLPNQARRYPRYGGSGMRITTSNDSAFASEEPQRRRSRSRCTHVGISRGQTCSCGIRVEERMVVQQQSAPIELQRYHRSSSNDVRREVGPSNCGRSANAENRIPSDTALRVRPLMPAASNASSNASAGIMRGNPADTGEWPIPYVAYLARYHANVSSSYVRVNSYGRFIVYDACGSDTPDIIYEMNGGNGCVEIIFRVYWCCTPGKPQIVRVLHPKEPNVVVSNETDPLVERNRAIKTDYRSLEDLMKAPTNVRTGYKRILSYVNLARNKQARRTVKNVFPGANMEIRYDGTIVMSFDTDSRQPVEVRLNGKSKNLETLLGTEKVAFDIVSAELTATHKALANAELSLPVDAVSRLRSLELITTPADIVRSVPERKKR